MSKLRYVLFGFLCFALCGFGIPGPQGSGGGYGEGDVAVFDSVETDDLIMENNATGLGVRNSGDTIDVVNFSYPAGVPRITFANSLVMRNSAASTLTVDSDGAGGAATLDVAEITNASGPVLTFNGNSAKAFQVNNGNASSTQLVTWTAGLGAITHLLGPSDQAFLLSSGSSQDMRLRSSSAIAYLDGGSGVAGRLAVASVGPVSSGSTFTIVDEGGDQAVEVQTNGSVSLGSSGDVYVRRFDTNVFEISSNGAGADYIRIGNNGSAGFVESAAGDSLLFNSAGTTALTLGTDQKATFAGVTNFTQTAASDSTTPTLIALPTGGTAAQAGWVAIEVNGSTAWIPYWQ